MLRLLLAAFQRKSLSVIILSPVNIVVIKTNLRELLPSGESGQPTNQPTVATDRPTDHRASRPTTEHVLWIRTDKAQHSAWGASPPHARTHARTHVHCMSGKFCIVIVRESDHVTQFPVSVVLTAADAKTCVATLAAVTPCLASTYHNESFRVVSKFGQFYGDFGVNWRQTIAQSGSQILGWVCTYVFDVVAVCRQVECLPLANFHQTWLSECTAIRVAAVSNLKKIDRQLETHHRRSTMAEYFKVGVVCDILNSVSTSECLDTEARVDVLLSFLERQDVALDNDDDATTASRSATATSAFANAGMRCDRDTFPSVFFVVLKRFVAHIFFNNGKVCSCKCIYLCERVLECTMRILCPHPLTGPIEVK